jgi:hypothetical protein
MPVSLHKLSVSRRTRSAEQVGPPRHHLPSPVTPQANSIVREHAHICAPRPCTGSWQGSRSFQSRSGGPRQAVVRSGTVRRSARNWSTASGAWPVPTVSSGGTGHLAPQGSVMRAPGVVQLDDVGKLAAANPKRTISRGAAPTCTATLAGRPGGRGPQAARQTGGPPCTRCELALDPSRYWPPSAEEP